MSSGSTSRENVLDLVRKHWDSASVSYDQSPGHGLSEPERVAWRRVLSRTLDPSPEGPERSILDVGTGTGEMASVLGSMGFKVTGVDLSPAMLAQARLKAQQEGTDLQTVEAEASNLPFPADSFDMVFSRHLFWNLIDPQAAVREWARVVRPGGMIAIADGWWEEPGRINEARRAVGRRLRSVLEPGHAENTDYELVRPHLPIAGGVSPYSVRYYLDSAGLKHIRVRDLKSVRAAERTVRPLWHRIDQARFTWLAVGIKPEE